MGRWRNVPKVIDDGVHRVLFPTWSMSIFKGPAAKCLRLLKGCTCVEPAGINNNSPSSSWILTLLNADMMLETTSGMELWFCSGRVSSPCLVRRVESICKLAPVYNRFDQPLVVKIFGSIIRLGSYTRSERGRCRRTEWHTLFSFFHNVDQTIQYVAVRRSNRKVFHAGPIGTPDLKTRSSHRSPTREMPFQY